MSSPAPRHLREFRLVTRIPQALFKPASQYKTLVAGLHYVARTDELYVTAPGNRTVNLLTPTASNSPLRPVYTAPAPSEPCAVCLVRQTGTLLIANFADDNSSRIEWPSRWWLCSATLSSGTKRVNCSSLRKWKTNFAYGGTLCELDSSTVLFGPHWSRQLFLLKMTKSHGVSLLRRSENF